MWLYARRKKGLFSKHKPIYPYNPHEGFIRKINIDSEKYYDFMIYDHKLSLVELAKYKLVFIGTIIEDDDNEY